MPHANPRHRMTRRVALPVVALVVMLAAQALLASVPVRQAQPADAAPPAQAQPAGAAGQARSRNTLPTPLTGEDFMRMLPPTDMGAGSRARRMAVPDGAPAVPFAAARVARNPLAPHAIPIGAKSCASCHALESVQASHTLHVTAFAATGDAGPQGACESCHGPGSEHAKRPEVRGLVISYTHEGGTPVDVQVGTCLGCHAGGARQHWTGSVHERRGLGCTDCHNPMTRLSAEGLLARPSINEVCATCHRDVRVQFNRRSHMPLPEGQLSCVDCHNPHGTVTQPLLKTATVNETCYSCHADKRGPFLFEHAPVRESCLNCHTPHGSNHADLLVLPVPMLCQQCHANFQHPNDLLTRQNLRSGLVPDERAMARGCLNCHSNIHGSNHPSGPTLVK